MSEKNPVTAAEIEKKLAETRVEMAATVDELVEQLDPRKQVKELAQKAKEKVDEAGDLARETVEKAKDGDTQSIGILAGITGGVLLFSGLVVRKLFGRG